MVTSGGYGPGRLELDAGKAGWVSIRAVIGVVFMGSPAERRERFFFLFQLCAVGRLF